MRGVVRRGVMALAVAVVMLGATAGYAAGSQGASVSATQVGVCVMSGSGDIAPGLSVLPQAELWTFTGEMNPCQGVNVFAGPFAGNIVCNSENLATCAPFGAFTLGTCAGLVFQQGPILQVECADTGGVGFDAGVLVFSGIPAAPPTLPVQNVIYSGAIAVTTF